MSTRTRKDWILAGSLACVLVGTVHAEYALAAATHMDWYVAWAVPGALDLYAIRALQKHRDVLPAVLVMVAANVASHLVAAGVLPIHWAVVSAVGALLPLLLWRVHRLRETSTDVPVTSTGPDAVSAPVLAAPGDDADWLPDFLTEEVHPSTPVLPPLPPEYAPGTPYSDVLRDSDWSYLGSATAYLDTCEEGKERPTIKGLMLFANIGQDRSVRLLDHMKGARRQ